MSTIFDRFHPVSDKFFADIREKGFKRYDSDPMVEVYQFKENVHSILSKSPGTLSDTWLHLIIGPKRALLIDTGFGVGDLKALVETLTDKPYDVVNTHSHGDHIIGNFQFDKVYCHEDDAESLRSQITPDVLKRFMPGEDAYFTVEDMVSFREYEVVPLPHGHIFDLGDGYEVELFHLPGHAAGGCGLLDKQNRILFSGDAVVSTPTLIAGPMRPNARPEALTVTAFRDSLQALAPRIDEFDLLFPGHNILNYPAKAVLDMLELCNQVIENPDAYTDIGVGMPNSGPTKLKVLGLASLAYTDNRI